KLYFKCCIDKVIASITQSTNNCSCDKILPMTIVHYHQSATYHCCSQYLPCPSKRSEEHTSELQSRFDLVCRLLLEKKKYSTEKWRGRKRSVANAHGWRLARGP